MQLPYQISLLSMNMGVTLLSYLNLQLVLFIFTMSKISPEILSMHYPCKLKPSNLSLELIK